MDYAAMEELGIASPVLSVSCQYESMVRFGDTVVVELELVEMKQVRFRLCYTVRDQKTGQIRARGETTHCFVDTQGKPISLKKHHPDIFSHMQTCVQAQP